VTASKLVNVLSIFALEPAGEADQVSSHTRVDYGGTRVVQFNLLVNKR